MGKFFNNIKNFGEFILDLIYPQECLGCQKEGSYLCSECLDKIKLTPDFYCALCHRPNEFGKVCPACGPAAALKAIWVAADYNQKIIQDLIHNLKYGYLEDISENLALIAVKYLKQNNILAEFDLNSHNAILVPVPLHQKRWLTRGFNQSELLARQIGKLMNLPMAKVLARIKNTETQINLKRSERQQNVKDAFKLTQTEFDSNKKVILIDDVVTTGSTLKECAQALAKAGFTEIYGLVIAQREN